MGSYKSILTKERILTILAKVVDLMASSQLHTLSKMIDEWHKLRVQLEHWQNCVKDKGFMDPVSVLDEEDSVFQSIWFTRGVCGQLSPIP